MIVEASKFKSCRVDWQARDMGKRKHCALSLQSICLTEFPFLHGKSILFYSCLHSFIHLSDQLSFHWFIHPYHFFNVLPYLPTHSHSFIHLYIHSLIHTYLNYPCTHLFAFILSHSFIHLLSHTHMVLYPDSCVNCWKHQDEQMEFCLEKDSSNIWPFK